jgi:uncharacterized protein with PIN domain
MSHLTKDLKANRLLPDSGLWRFSKMKKLPPRCPYCEKRLVEVLENEYNTYVFDSLLGTYRKHDWKGEIEMFCPYCNAKIYDVFPDGVCNYVSRNKSHGVDSMNKRQIT